MSTPTRIHEYAPTEPVLPTGPRTAYVGETDAADEPNGLGHMVMADGSMYDGAFVNGLPHGLGRCVYIKNNEYNGDYTGEWAHGRRSGLGTMRYVDGWRYQGEWTDDKKNGYGRLFMPVKPN